MNRTLLVVITVVVTIGLLALLGGVVKRSYLKGASDTETGTVTV